MFVWLAIDLIKPSLLLISIFILGTNRFTQSPRITIPAEAIFQDSKGSFKKIVELNIPNIGARREKGAMVDIGYLDNNQLQAENPNKVVGYTI